MNRIYGKPEAAVVAHVAPNPMADVIRSLSLAEKLELLRSLRQGEPARVTPGRGELDDQQRARAVVRSATLLAYTKQLFTVSDCVESVSDQSIGYRRMQDCIAATCVIDLGRRGWLGPPPRDDECERSPRVPGWPLAAEVSCPALGPSRRDLDSGSGPSSRAGRGVGRRGLRLQSPGIIGAVLCRRGLISREAT